MSVAGIEGDAEFERLVRALAAYGEETIGHPAAGPFMASPDYEIAHELFGFRGGSEWHVGHYLFAKRGYPSA